VDMTTGTGWPFGGTGVSEQDASSKLVLKRYEVTGGGTVQEKLPDGRLLTLQGESDTGEKLDLKWRVINGSLVWPVPSGKWRIYAVLAVGPVQKVKRAAPGGEGNVLDPFSVGAITRYLEHFDKAGGAGLRAQFHDSYEYYSASWTPDLYAQFSERRWYQLGTELPALFGDAGDDQVARVKHDYRQTIAELHLGYVQAWTDWTHRHGQQTREQAHGAPANLLDVYAAATLAVASCRRGDGPVFLEAETFRMGGHATHDEAEARATFSAALFADWGKRDPVGLYETWLIESGPKLAEDKDNRAVLAEAEARIIAEVDAAAEDALKSRATAVPPPESAIEGVYAVSAESPIVGAKSRA